jgi:ABC-2 type transport system permease protein
MTAFFALVRKELAQLFGSPLAYLALTFVVLVTALIFFDHLRIYNQILFLYNTPMEGGFDADAIPDHVNLRDLVFFPVMETLGLTLIALIPVVTMRVFAEERARGTEELLLTTRLTPTQIVLAKFTVTYLFVLAMMVASFVYPAMAIAQGGLGADLLLSVFLGLTLLGLALASIGLACSAFTASQLVAAVAAWAIGFVVWDWNWLTPFLGESEAAVRFFDAISLHPRYGTFAEGLVNAANVVFFLALGAVCAAIARFATDWRRVAG